MSTSGEPSRWGAESSWPYRSRFLSLEEKKGRHSPVPGYRLPDGPCRQCGVAGKKASGLNEGGKSSLLLMVEGQPCAPSPPGQHDHCHPTVLFTTAAWKDLVPPLRGWRRSLLQSSPRLRMEAALTPVHPVESRCSEWPLRDQQWACYTWGRHSVLPATSPDTCRQKKIPTRSSCLFIEPRCFSEQELLYPCPSLSPRACLVSRQDVGDHPQGTDGRGGPRGPRRCSLCLGSTGTQV